MIIDVSREEPVDIGVSDGDPAGAPWPGEHYRRHNAGSAELAATKVDNSGNHGCDTPEEKTAGTVGYAAPHQGPGEDREEAYWEHDYVQEATRIGSDVDGSTPDGDMEHKLWTKATQIGAPTTGRKRDPT